MSKYNQSLILVSLFLIPAIVTGQWLGAWAILFVFLVVTGIGSASIRSNFFLHSINRADTRSKCLVLSFDDGPSPTVTPAVLDILKEFECRAVFFCIGRKIAGNEELVRRIVNEGHIVANHSFSHAPWFDLYSANRMLEEIQATNEEIRRVTGLRCKLFRPPYGVTNPMLTKAIDRSGLFSIGWSKRSLDTVIRDKRKVLARISRNLQPGDIILLHDSVPGCPGVLKTFLENLQQTEYTIERLDRVIDIDCYEN